MKKASSVAVVVCIKQITFKFKIQNCLKKKKKQEKKIAKDYQGYQTPW